MLRAVETHFHRAVRAAVPAATPVTAGPAVGPASKDVAALVELAATRLAIVYAPGDDDPAAARDRARFAAVHRWSGDGGARDFTLPDGLAGEVAELESPPGRPLRAGDDYFVDGRTVRLMRPPPAAPDNLVARLRGGPARGFVDRRRCVISLQADAWATDAAALAALSSRVHAALLAAAAEVPQLEAAPQDDLGVRVRLLRPTALWVASARAPATARDAPFLRETIEFQVRGELEQRVVLGAPEPVGIIEQIVHTPPPK
jgi:hypothetical protein